MSTQPNETIEYKGYKIQIFTDSDPFNPREDDNLGKMACWHDRYNLGDFQPKISPDEFIVELAGISVPYFVEQEDIKRAWKYIDKHFVILPLYLYDHSGITMSVGGFADPWDSGQVGWIYVDYQTIREEYRVKRVSKQLRARVAGYLKSEVETYDDYLTNNVYGYKVIPPDGEDEIDSCWGFYGYDHKASGLLEYAENAVDCALENVE